MKLITRPYLMSILRMTGAIASHPHIPLWYTEGTI